MKVASILIEVLQREFEARSKKIFFLWRQKV